MDHMNLSRVQSAGEFLAAADGGGKGGGGGAAVLPR
jgi:hypothetical protein